MNCLVCSSPLPLNGKFCGSCGTPLAPPVTELPPQPVVPQQIPAHPLAAPQPIYQQQPLPPQPMLQPPYPQVQPQPGYVSIPQHLVNTALPVNPMAYVQHVMKRPYVRSSEVKTAAIMGICWGMFYIIASAILYGIDAAKHQNQGDLIYAPFDLLLGLLIVIPSVLMLRTKTTGKTRTCLLISGITLTIIGLLAGFGLVIYIPPIIFFALALHELRNYQ